MEVVINSTANPNTDAPLVVTQATKDENETSLQSSLISV